MGAWSSPDADGAEWAFDLVARWEQAVEEFAARWGIGRA